MSSQVRSLQRDNLVLLDVGQGRVVSKAFFRDHLAEEEVLEVILDFEVLPEGLNKVDGVNTLDLLVAVLRADQLQLSDGVVSQRGLLSLDDDLLQVGSEVIHPEVE